MKKHLLFLTTILIACTFIACGSNISIGDKTPYTTVNDFPDASIEVIEVNSSEEYITVEISYSGENELTYGEVYEIEIYQDNEWHALDYKKYAIHDLGYEVKSGSSQTETYTLIRYGDIPSGHYRIVIVVHDFIESGNLTAHNLAAEFDIK